MNELTKDLATRLNEAITLAVIGQAIPNEWAGLMEEVEMVTEGLRVAHEIGDTFWDALKPLNLPAINVRNPGQHVTDLLRRAEVAEALAERRRKTLEVMLAPAVMARHE